MLTQQRVTLAVTLCLLSACSHQRSETTAQHDGRTTPTTVTPAPPTLPQKTQTTTLQEKRDVAVGHGNEVIARTQEEANKTRDESAFAFGGGVPTDATAKAKEDKFRASEAPRAKSELHGLAQLFSRDASERNYRENYAQFDDNPVKRAAEHPVSTFSVDVDTGAYSNVRRMLNAGTLPPQEAVRVEEMINYFNYDYTPPRDMAHPFSVFTELGVNPWNPQTHLLHIGLKGYVVPKETLAAANLVFLVDVSGSMQSPDKLELLKSSLKLLTTQLRAQDRISLIVYAGTSGVVLEPVAGSEKAKITAAIDSLQAGGSTNGGSGIRLAYAMAEQAFVRGGINRVLLATDGDFNVGVTQFDDLKDLVENKRKSGVSLTTLGFGTGNYNDRLMEQLADAGNGNYAYIDNLNEARKVLVEQMSSTFQTIAKDVKIQIEFNPAYVAEYRLVGYENRTLAREDFNNDQVDAGDIGAGHSVTALYEILLTSSEKGKRIDPLRYQSESSSKSALNNELAYLRLRYKDPIGDKSQLIEQVIAHNSIKPDLARTSDTFRFAAAVAGFGQLLRGGKYTTEWTLGKAADLARQARGSDELGYRGELLGLIALAEALLPTAILQSGVDVGRRE